MYAFFVMWFLRIWFGLVRVGGWVFRGSGEVPVRYLQERSRGSGFVLRLGLE